MGRRSELRPGGAAAGGEIQALGVEADRPPDRARGLMAREPRQCGWPERVCFREEPTFGPGQRRFALPRDENLGRRERGSAAKPAVEMHVLDPERKTAKSAKPA